MRIVLLTLTVALSLCSVVSQASARTECTIKNYSYMDTFRSKRYSLLTTNRRVCRNSVARAKEHCAQKYKGRVVNFGIRGARREGVVKKLGNGKRCVARYWCILRRYVCKEVSLQTLRSRHEGGDSSALATKKRVCQKAAAEARKKCSIQGRSVQSFTWKTIRFIRAKRRRSRCLIEYTCRIYTNTR